MQQNAAATPITINVRDNKGKTIALKATTDSLFKDIFEAYAEKEFVDLQAVRFIHDGYRISLADTPKTFEMVDNCFIDVTIPQRGGFCGGLIDRLITPDSL